MTNPVSNHDMKVCSHRSARFKSAVFAGFQWHQQPESCQETREVLWRHRVWSRLLSLQQRYQHHQVFQLITKLCVLGESDVDIQDSVRGKNVYIVQSSGRDTNNHLMGLLLFVQVFQSSCWPKNISNFEICCTLQLLDFNPTMKSLFSNAPKVSMIFDYSVSISERQVNDFHIV